MNKVKKVLNEYELRYKVYKVYTKRRIIYIYVFGLMLWLITILCQIEYTTGIIFGFLAGAFLVILLSSCNKEINRETISKDLLNDSDYKQGLEQQISLTIVEELIKER